MQKEPWNDDNGMQCSLQIRCKSLTPNRWSSTSQEAAKRDSRNTLSGNMEVGDQVAGNLAVNFLLGHVDNSWAAEVNYGPYFREPRRVRHVASPRYLG